MNRINSYGIEPGPYKDKDHQGDQAGANHGPVVVATEIVNQLYNQETRTFQALQEPIVIVRDLNDLSIEWHRRYGYPLNIFKHKFQKA